MKRGSFGSKSQLRFQNSLAIVFIQCIIVFKACHGLFTFYLSRAMRKCVLCHMRTTKAQISAFVVRCLDCIISLDSISEISRLYLASVATQASLSLAWSETPEDTFCRVVAHLFP